MTRLWCVCLLFACTPGPVDSQGQPFARTPAKAWAGQFSQVNEDGRCWVNTAAPVAQAWVEVKCNE